MQNCPKWPVCQSSNHPISGSSNTAAWIFHGVNTADFFFPNACASMRPAIMSVWIIKYNKWLVSSMRNGIQLRSQPAWLSECPTSGRSMGISNTREIRGVDMTGIIKGGGHNSRRACPWCTVFMMSCVFVQETWMNGCADGNGIAMKAAQKELSCGWVLDWVFFFFHWELHSSFIFCFYFVFTAWLCMHTQANRTSCIHSPEMPVHTFHCGGFFLWMLRPKRSIMLAIFSYFAM